MWNKGVAKGGDGWDGTRALRHSCISLDQVASSSLAPGGGAISLLRDGAGRDSYSSDCITNLPPPHIEVIGARDALYTGENME